MAERMTSKMKERTGAGLRLAGLGGLLAIVALAAVDPGSAPRAVAAAEPELGAADAFRMPTRFNTTFEPYPGTALQPIGMLVANGNDVEMHFFRTKDEPRRVLDYFGEQFGKRGYHVEYQERDGLGAVSFYDPDYGALVSVSTMKQEGGETLAFPSVISVPEGVALSAKPPEFLPKPKGVVTIARIEDRNMGRAAGSVSVSQMAPGAPSMLAAFYREEMDKRGWTGGEARTERDVQFLSFEKDGEEATITVSPIEKHGDDAESLIMTVVEKKR